MKRMILFPIACALLLCAGCASSNGAKDAEADNTGKEQSGKKAAKVVTGQGAYVFIDGKLEGVTPATIRVRRSFGESEVLVKVGKEEKRKFEIERVYSSNRSMIDYSYGADNFGGVRGLDLTDLYQDKNGVYLIPYYSSPIEIEDREYGLTLIVEN